MHTNRILKYIFIFSLLSSVIPIWATSIKYSNVRFKQLGEKEGLPRNTVFDITQDERGFMWFCTSDGICRYDGYDIEKYSDNLNDSLSVTNNITESVLNDTQRNMLWIASTNGICCFDNKGQSFKRYLLDGSSPTVSSFTTSNDGTIFNVSDLGVFYYDENADHFKKIFDCSKGNRLFFDYANRAWLVNNLTLSIYDRHFKNKLPLPKALSDIHEFIRFSKILDRKIYAFATESNLYAYDIEKNKLKVYASIEKTGIIRCAEEDIDGNIWFGGENGIYIFDKNGTLLSHYEQNQGDVSLLNDSPTYCIFRDRDNNMWIGTYFGGVNYYIYGTDKFSLFLFGYSKNRLSGKVVRNITDDGKGGLFLTTEDGGLNYVNSNNKIIRSSELNTKFKLDTKNIHYLYIDNDNKYWFGLLEEGVQCYDNNTGKLIKYRSIGREHSSGFCITEDNKNRIFYAGPTGIYKIDKEATDTIAHRISDLPSIWLLNYDDSTLWVGSRFDGVWNLNLNTLRIEPMNLLPDNKIRITYLYRDSNSNIWIATNNNGLFIVNSHNKLIHTFSDKQLMTSGIRGIIEDDNGDIWVGTTNGLFDFKKDFTFKRFSSADGLPINQFNLSSVCKRDGNQLYFGTINGMISFNPNDMEEITPKFDVVITGLWSNDELLTNYYSSKSQPSTSTLVLSHKQAKSISIKYSALNYKYAANTIYSLKLEGTDKQWQNVGYQHQVRFSDLKSGKYNLKIRASCDGKSWDDEGQLSFMLKVKPPFWLSWWAYVFYGFCVIGIGLGIYTYAKSRLTLNVQLQEEKGRRKNAEILNKQVTDFYTNISHDLKTPLTLIISPLQRVISHDDLPEKTKEKLRLVYNNARRMNYLIDNLLSYSKIKMKRERIIVKKGNLMQFLKIISEAFNELAENNDIEYIVDLHDRNEDVWFSPSILERVLFNLLSNAFKFTKYGGFVKLSANYKTVNDEIYAVIEVQDNGRGIAENQINKIFEKYYQIDTHDDKEGYGIGLSLTKSLVIMHKGDISVKSCLGEGSTFSVILNVSCSAFSEDEKSQESISLDEIESYNKEIKDSVDIIPSNTSKAEKGKNRILIVEDNKELNDYIKEIFNNEYTIIQAFDGEKAFNILNKQPIDLVISDVIMSKMDGFVLTSKIKQDINTSHIPVMLLTAKTDNHDITQGYKVGADAYITKPFNADNLKLLVSNILKNRDQIIDHIKNTDEVENVKLSDNPTSEIFMKELINIIMSNINNENFNVEAIVQKMNISRSSLHMKVKSMTGCSITQFIRAIKMKEAKKRLLNGMNISETSFAVGINDPSYFTKCFKKEFGVTPSEFIKSIKDK